MEDIEDKNEVDISEKDSIIESKEEIKNAIENYPCNTSIDYGADRMAQKLDQQKEWGILIATERKGLIEMRASWSNHILFVIVLISMFDMLLIVAIGAGWLKYEDSFQVPLFVGESLIKLLGLAFLIVHFLFDHKTLSKNTSFEK